MICGTTHKTVKRLVAAQLTGELWPARRARTRNFDPVAAVVRDKVAKTQGKISAKRLLPVTVAAGYSGSACNFRRLLAVEKAWWRRTNGRARRPGVWSPGETLIIDWGVDSGLHVFCAVLAWSRFRFVRFAADEKATTTRRLLAECFEVLGGVSAVVLADRMGCLKGGVVANVVVPTADYVRFAAHYRFRPDFCEGHDPESKGMVKNLVAYAKHDLVVPQAPFTDLPAANEPAAAWCTEVNAATHSEICAMPAERLQAERELLGALPSLRPRLDRAIIRTVDRLSCVRVGSARYSVPTRLIGQRVVIDAGDGRLRIVEPVTGELAAEHELVAPGETSILDEHYGSTRPDRPRRAPRPKTPTEREFLGVGPIAEAFVTGAAAAAVDAGHRVRYYTAAELVETLYRGLADNSVGRVIDTILRNDLIVIDELGFAPLDDTGAQLLIRIVAAGYERRALAIGSHWHSNPWGRVPRNIHIFTAHQ